MFQKFLDLKLRTKLLLSICTVAWLAFAATITYIGLNARSMAEKEALDKARQTAYRYANLTQAELGQAMEVVRTVAFSFQGMKQQGCAPT